MAEFNLECKDVPLINSSIIDINFLEIRDDINKNNCLHTLKSFKKGEIIFKEIPLKIYLDDEFLTNELDTNFIFNKKNFELFFKENTLKNKLKHNSFFSSFQHLQMDHELLILFRLISKINHSYNNNNCIITPSYQHIIFNYIENKEILFSLIALKDINPGDELLISYYNKDFVTNEEIYNLKNIHNIIERPINIKEKFNLTKEIDIWNCIIEFYKKYTDVNFEIDKEDNSNLLTDFCFLEEFIDNIFINNILFFDKRNNILELNDQINSKKIFFWNVYKLILHYKKNLLIENYIQIEIKYFENLLFLNDKDIVDLFDDKNINLILLNKNIIEYNDSEIYDINLAIINIYRTANLKNEINNPLYEIELKDAEEKKRCLKSYFDFILKCSIIKKN